MPELLCKAETETTVPVRPGDERRPASPLAVDGAAATDDKCAVAVPTTAELVPLPTDGSTDLQALLAAAVDALGCSDDWAKQYESVTLARRVVVFAVRDGEGDENAHALPPALTKALVTKLALLGDDLRSALARNALLALAECFERLPRAHLERVLLLLPGQDQTSELALMDMLLRRCVCEKRFLRDAALQAVAALARGLAGAPLMAAAARFASSRNARLCGHAAGLIAGSLEQLTRRRAAREAGDTPPSVYKALAALREGKDAAARAQAAASFKLLARLLGRDAFSAALAAALGPTGSLAAGRIMKEACASSAGGEASRADPPARRGSLRDRVQLESRSRSGQPEC